MSRKISHKVNKPIPPVTIVVGLVIVIFALLVSSGITGSSLALLYDQAPFLNAKTISIALSPEAVRSDEYVVITPMAIGQMNHQPPFPIINQNLGVAGQNMLVIGMTGIPTNHLSLLAKPATWGFHVFDLKRALAWYWWFPVFGCFLALWWLFGLLIPGQWRLGFCLSLLFCLSPYSVAWSNWPAYAVFFPTIALCSTMLLLHQKHWLQLTASAVLLGLSIAGFVLVLYPPWQVSLGYLYLATGIGLIIRDRSHLNIDIRKVAAFGLAIIIAIVILYSWWIDAKPAIDAMLNTVYPGRRLLAGGGASLSELLRGFTNIGSLYKLDDGASNQSEIASFYYLFLPLMIAIGIRLKESRVASCLIIPLVLFVAYSLTYMFYGVPEIIARMSLWSKVPTHRVDLALGLSYILLCGLVLAGRKYNDFNSEKRKPFVYLVSLVWTIVVANAILTLPKGVLAGMTSGVVAALLLAAFLSSVWLMLRDVKKFMAISLAICAATTLPFNPLAFAVKKVEIKSEIENFLVQTNNPKHVHKRVLVLESQIPAMALMSAGVPTVNGVLYYPQMSLWTQLGVDSTMNSIFNRYQHLIFTAGTVGTPNALLLESPQPDVVRVTVDGEHFNFGLTGAELVTVPQAASKKLERNQSLRYILSSEGWAWFNVRNETTKPP